MVPFPAGLVPAHCSTPLDDRKLVLVRLDPMTTPSNPETPAIYYRLRSGFHQPAFHPGELYQFLRKDMVEGYIFLLLGGRPRCVSEAAFERAEAPIT